MKWRPRPDVARLARVDGPDRDLGHRQAQRDAAGDHLDLELEAGLGAVEQGGHQTPADEPVAGLVVRDPPADRRREHQAPERVRQPPHGRHRAEVAPAEHELRPVDGERSQEGGDLRGVVLTVRVEGDDRRRVVRQRVPEAGAQGRALARVRALDEDGGAGGLRLAGGVVGRAVVDDDDRQVQRARPTRRPRCGDLPGSRGSARGSSPRANRTASAAVRDGRRIGQAATGPGRIGRTSRSASGAMSRRPCCGA